MRGRELKQTLQAGSRVFGIAVEGYGQPRWPAFFANLGIVDFVFMDSEHSPNNRETIAWAAQCYAAHGIAPLVRITEPSPTLAAMAVDAGAHGIIVPYVETVAQARAMVGAIKYRPLKGRALQHALDTGEFPSPETGPYLEAYNPDAFLVIMIESPAGIEQLPAMLEAGGIDAILVGPHDLTVSLGIPEQYEHPKFIEAMQQIIGICQQYRVGVGMHIIFGTLENALQWLERGFTFISYRGDTLFTASGIQNELGWLREQVGQPAPKQQKEIGASGHSK